MVYTFQDLLGLDVIQAGEIMTAAGPFAIDATRTAVEVYLNHIVG